MVAVQDFGMDVQYIMKRSQCDLPADQEIEFDIFQHKTFYIDGVDQVDQVSKKSFHCVCFYLISPGRKGCLSANEDYETCVVGYTTRASRRSQV
jgi:hypothetical protein